MGQKIEDTGEVLHLGFMSVVLHKESDYQLDGHGPLYAVMPSSQMAPRVMRIASRIGLPIWEWDMRIATYARFLWELRQGCSPEKINRDFFGLAMIVEGKNIDIWRAAVARYSDITREQAKILIAHTRKPC